MKRFLGTFVLGGLIIFVLGFSRVYVDNSDHKAAITIDSTADSSAAGLITVFNDTIVLEENGSPIKSLLGTFIVEPSLETARGFGLADSAFVALQTFGFGRAPATLASRGQLLLPCTLFISLINVDDTLFKRHLQFTVQILDTSAADSLVDSVTTANNGRVIRPYNLRWEMIGRD